MFTSKEIKAARDIADSLQRDEAAYTVTFDIYTLRWDIQVYTMLFQPWFHRSGHDLAEVADIVRCDLDKLLSDKNDVDNKGQT